MADGGIIEELSIAIGFKPKLRELDQARTKATKAAEATDKAWKDASARVERAQEAVAKAGSKAAKETARRWLASAKQKEKAAKAAAQAAGKAAREMARDFKKAADAASRDSKAVKEAWVGAMREVGAITTRAFAGAARSAASFVGDTIQNGRKIKREAADIGASAEEYQRVARGFELIGIESDNTFEAVKTFRENLGELERLGTGPAKDALGSLGLELEDIIDLPLEKQLEVFSAAMAGLENDSQRLSVAIEIMGEDGRMLLPALRAGADGVRELGDQAAATGTVMSQEMLDKLEDLDGRIRVAKAQATGFALSLIEESGPAFDQVGAQMSEWVNENQEFIQQDMPEVVSTLGSAVMVLADAFAGLGSMIAGAKREADALAESLSDFAIDQKISDASIKGGIEDALGLKRGALGGISKESAAASRKRVGRGQVGFLNPENERKRQQQIADRKARKARDIAASEAAAKNATAALVSGFAGSDLSDVDKAAGIAQSTTFQARERFAAGKTEDKKRTARETVERLGSVRAAAQFLDTSEAQISEFTGQQTKKRGGGGRRRAKEKKDKQSDPLMSMLLGEDVPDVELSKIARGAEPQVLTSIINNTFSFDIDQQIDGSGDPTDVAQRIVAEVRDKFEAAIAKSTKTTKVRFSR